MTNPVRKKKEEARQHGVASMLVDRDYESLVALANLARRKHVETGELSQLVAWSDALALLGAHHVDPLPEPALRTWLDEQLLALDHMRVQLSEEMTMPERFISSYQQLLPLLQEARERTPAMDMEAVKEAGCGGCAGESAWHEQSLPGC